jgi:DNA-binding GntR family transcriptional regulator
MQKIERKKLSNQVYDILKDMIINHRFQPGTRINVEQITKEIGVSRTPVWEAVSRLEHEALVVNIPNRGVFMAVLTPEQALELYAVRQVLEGLAARLAATCISEQMLAKMADCLERQQQVIDKQDLREYSILDFQFHATVYEACGNSCLQEMLEAIKNKMRPIRLSLQLQPILPRLYADHVRLFKALQSHDADGAEQVFCEHNQFMIALIKQELGAGRWQQLGIAGNS